MQNNPAYDWNDLRHFLAVARAGSTLGGARLLGVNQTTVARRIAALEAALGRTLFERRQDGYRLTEAGALVRERAERVEAEAQSLAALLAAQGRQLRGTVRVTTNEGLANAVLIPFLRGFRAAQPGVRVELHVDDRRLDIAGGEADLALRAGSRPEGAGIVARRLGDLGWTVYGSAEYAARHGLPASPEELARHALIGVEGTFATTPHARWLEAQAPEAEIGWRSNSLTNLQVAVQAGMGLATLPCLVADADPLLRRCFPPVPALRSELWLVIREELRAAQHVRALVDALVAHLEGMRGAMLGEP